MAPTSTIASTAPTMAKPSRRPFATFIVYPLCLVSLRPEIAAHEYRRNQRVLVAVVTCARYARNCLAANLHLHAHDVVQVGREVRGRNLSSGCVEVPQVQPSISG